MGLTEKILNKALQKIAKKTIVDVFEREIEEYSEQLKAPKGKILGYISRYLNGLRVNSQEGRKVIKIFKGRAKHYSGNYPLFSKEVIEAVVREHMGQWFFFMFLGEIYLSPFFIGERK